MTKDNLEFMTLKEAARLLSKSDRTIKRYLSKLDNDDKNRMSYLSNGRVMVSMEFIDLAKNGHFSNIKIKSKKDSIKAKKEQTEHIKGEYIDRIESLEARNKELFEIIKKKDGQLQEKDELIKANLDDFKMLTSKVLFLQEENLKLQKPVEEKKGKEVMGVSSEPNFSDSLLLFLAVGFVGLIAAIGYLILV